MYHVSCKPGQNAQHEVQGGKYTFPALARDIFYCLGVLSYRAVKYNLFTAIKSVILTLQNNGTKELRHSFILFKYEFFLSQFCF